MRTSYVIAAIGCILILGAGLIAGCTGTSPATQTPAVPLTPVTTIADPTATGTWPTPVSTSAAIVSTIYVNASSNGKIVTIPMGSRVLVRLSENPTTGYTWNATASKGLAIISDTYTSPDGTLIGAPGHRDFTLSPKAVDTYTFRAVSLRPWEGAKAEDPAFSLVILVTND
jgi:inhibitor of cysteine peptidase